MLKRRTDLVSTTKSGQKRSLDLNKWSDKKDKLEQFNAMCNTPKILPHRNITSVVNALQK